MDEKDNDDGDRTLVTMIRTIKTKRTAMYGTMMTRTMTSDCWAAARLTNTRATKI